MLPDIEHHSPITSRGNPSLLDQPLAALFCSKRCPGDLILQAYDAAQALRDAAVPLIGGFHTPIEKDCLEILLRGMQPVVMYPARGIGRMQVKRPWREPWIKADSC